MTRIGNVIGEWLYRRFNGRFSSPGKNVLVLMLTVPGRRTGVVRSTCVRYLEVPEGLVVWGTGSGSRQVPDWFKNLRHADVIDVQIKARHFSAVARELRGAERDAMWRDTVLANVPEVEKYARKAGRVIPVAVLTPVERPTKS